MKRNWKIVHFILKTISEDTQLESKKFISKFIESFPNCDKKILFYHLDIMYDRGMITNYEKRQRFTLNMKLSWEGQDLLNVLDDQDFLNSLKLKANKSGDIMNLDTILTIIAKTGLKAITNNQP